VIRACAYGDYYEGRPRSRHGPGDKKTGARKEDVGKARLPPKSPPLKKILADAGWPKSGALRARDFPKLIRGGFDERNEWARARLSRPPATLATGGSVASDPRVPTSSTAEAETPVPSPGPSNRGRHRRGGGSSRAGPGGGSIGQGGAGQGAFVDRSHAIKAAGPTSSTFAPTIARVARQSVVSAELDRGAGGPPDASLLDGKGRGRPAGANRGRAQLFFLGPSDFATTRFPPRARSSTCRGRMKEAYLKKFPGGPRLTSAWNMERQRHHAPVDL